MQRRNFLKSIGLLSAGLALPVADSWAQEGDEFVSRQVSGKVTGAGKGLAGVIVSDGYTVAQTDKNGVYKMNTHHDAKFIFVSLPSGYEIPNDKGISKFYSPLHKNGKAEEINFELHKLTMDDQKHTFIVWADPQMQNAADTDLFHRTSVPDTKAHVAAMGDVPVFGIACGDIAFDHFEVYDDYKRGVAATGIPFFQVIGNHDMDYNARTDNESQATFTSLFGPTYYSFNRGKVHYVVLDNVFFIGSGHKYIGYLTEEQLKWLEKDLQFVPKGNTVVVAMHIPSNTGARIREKQKEESMGGVVMNRQALYDILKPYKVQIVSGHTHWNEIWEKDNIIEHNLGTLCGAWWSGPICGDGTPNGYGVFEVDGDQISWYYKSTGFEKSHQMRVYQPGVIEDKPEYFMANIWNHDERWTIEWFEDGVGKGSLEKYTGQDASAIELYKGKEKPLRHKGVEPNTTDHLFIAKPSANAKEIKVVAKDRFGNVFEERLLLHT